MRPILIVDDDPHIREVLAFALDRAGYATLHAADGAEALAQAEAHDPALIVLDVAMPKLDGLEVCRRLRARARTPILFLSSRTDEIDRIVGLEVGGDDYVVKPFSPREIVARVKAILKRAAPPDSPEDAGAEPLRRGLLTLDLDAYAAAWEATSVPLTATEFALLRALVAAPTKVFTRDELIDRLHGPGFALSDRTIDSHVRHLRAKFAAAGADEVIATVHGIGYRLGPCGRAGAG